MTLLTTSWHTQMLLRFCRPTVTWACRMPSETWDAYMERRSDTWSELVVPLPEMDYSERFMVAKALFA